MAATAIAAQNLELQEEEELEEFQLIEKLQQLGINQGDIKKAKEAGYHTCESLLMNTRKKLSDIKGLSEAKVEKLLDAARKLCTDYGWRSAKRVEQQRAKEIVKISLGASAANELLGGGLESRCITEIYGEFRTGKTQICHTLCVTTQLPVEQGGGAGKVAFIDTEGTFRAEKIRAIAARFDLDADAVLDNIIHARAYTHEAQIAMITMPPELLVPLAAKMSEEPFRLIIMDSITANLRVDFTGRGELAERQQKLGYIMSRLRKLSEEFNVAVLITNHVVGTMFCLGNHAPLLGSSDQVSDPSGGAMFVADPKKPVGGHVLAHASTIRISLRKGKGEQRLMKVVDAPNLPEAEASFQLSSEGVTDYKD